MMSRIAPIFVASLALAACSKPAEPKPTPTPSATPSQPPAPESPAAEPPAPTPTAEAPPAQGFPPEAAAKAMQPFLGKWKVRLTQTQERQLGMMRMAFEPKDPSAERLAAYAKEEQALLNSIREAWKRNPTDQRLQEMRTVVEGMSKSTLDVTTSTLTLIVGGTGQAAPYRVFTAEAGVVTIDAKAKSGRIERMTITPKGGDAIELRKQGEGDPLTFVRR
ncbi:MAG: hypothetical protein U1E65_15185 [Myxococcota bacterium]